MMQMDFLPRLSLRALQNGLLSTSALNSAHICRKVCEQLTLGQTAADSQTSPG